MPERTTLVTKPVNIKLGKSAFRTIRLWNILYPHLISLIRDHKNITSEFYIQLNL